MGCQKENLQEEALIYQNIKGHKLQTYIYQSDSIVRANKDLYRTVTSKFEKSNSSSSRYIESTTHGFVIDTSQVQLLVSDFYESYAFKVYRETENPDILENYVVTYFNDSTYSQILISYPYDTVLQKWDIENGSVLEIQDDDLLARNFSNCGAEEFALTEWVNECTDFTCTSGEHSGTGAQGDCNYKGIGMPYTECEGGYVTYCVPSGGGSGNTGPGNTGPGGIGVIPYNSSNGLNDTRTRIKQALGFNVIGGDFVEENAWLDDVANAFEVVAIDHYLEDHENEDGSYEQEALDFAEGAINESLEGSELDMVNEIIKDSTFINTKADCVYELLKSTGNNLFKDLMSDFTNNKSKSKLKFQIGTVPDAADGLTTYDSDTGIITITFPPAINTLTSLEIAALILHEGLQAELRRIYIGNNQVLEPLPQAQFNYLVSYYEYYKGIVAANNVSNFASHTYMVYNHLEPLARAVSELDDNHYNLNHYMWYAWDGLSVIGKNAIPPLLTTTEENNYQNLQQITITDLKKQDCDE
ncbi:hypothetical protein [Psychroserpens damuponensis]|uniref:hypothetical protein n=1 Tax=Psychroserpens damuponensis TaxID=943936 RepID=UPI00058D8267|nr:hypothetical protein [Psychroserpens damuponensis]